MSKNGFSIKPILKIKHMVDLSHKAYVAQAVSG